MGASAGIGARVALSSAALTAPLFLAEGKLAFIGLAQATAMITRQPIEAPIQSQLQYADLVEAIERRYVEEHGVL